MSTEKKIQLTIRDVPEHIVIWLDIEAAKARTSREELLRALLKQIARDGLPKDIQRQGPAENNSYGTC